MRALLLSEYKQLAVAEMQVPQCGRDEVRVQVAACGICGSDVHGYDGTSGRRIPPIVMGHEAAGTIVDVGQDVSGLRIGDRVTFDSTVYCGRCSFCVRGQMNLCDNRQVVGVSCGDYRRSGAFAEYVTVPAHIVYILPEELSFAQAAMLEAVSVALHGVRVATVTNGESALVIGAGMIGLLLLQAARAAGCSPVYVADLDESRLIMAAELGAARTFKPSGEAVAADILELTEGRGVDVVFEAVGIDASVNTAVECVRKGGTITLVGNIAKSITIPLQKIVTRQIRLQGSCASAGEYPEAMRLMASGKIRVDGLISAIAPLEEGPAWFARLYNREPNLMKVILDPRLSAETAP